MKPTALKPGDKVTCNGYEMTFVRRIPSWQSGRRSAVNVFQCPAFASLNGPNDKGLCEMNDYLVARKVTREAA